MISEITYFSPEDYLIRQRYGNIVKRCVECNGTGTKWHKIFGHVPCDCHQVVCKVCAGSGVIPDVPIHLSCWYCDSWGFQVALCSKN